MEPDAGLAREYDHCNPEETRILRKRTKRWPQSCRTTYPCLIAQPEHVVGANGKGLAIARPRNRRDNAVEWRRLEQLPSETVPHFVCAVLTTAHDQPVHCVPVSLHDDTIVGFPLDLSCIRLNRLDDQFLAGCVQDDLIAGTPANGVHRLCCRRTDSTSTPTSTLCLSARKPTTPTTNRMWQWVTATFHCVTTL